MDSAVTSEMARMWAKEVLRLKDSARDLGVQIRLLEEKLAAAETLGLYSPTGQGILLDSVDVPGEQDDEESSLPSMILDVMKHAETALRPPQIKDHLLNRGVEKSKFGRNGSYFYSCLGRLVKRKQIAKKGKKYIAVK